MYRAGDHANVASLPMCSDRVSGRTATSETRSETRETRRADFFFPRGAFGRMTETEKAETETSRSSRSSSGVSASDASDALELSSSDSDDPKPPTTPRRRITASRAADASRRKDSRRKRRHKSTLSARAGARSRSSSLETRGQRALGLPTALVPFAPPDARSARTRTEPPAARARCAGRAAAAGTARAASRRGSQTENRRAGVAVGVFLRAPKRRTTRFPKSSAAPCGGTRCERRTRRASPSSSVSSGR